MKFSKKHGCSLGPVGKELNCKCTGGGSSPGQASFFLVLQDRWVRSRVETGQVGVQYICHGG